MRAETTRSAASIVVDGARVRSGSKKRIGSRRIASRLAMPSGHGMRVAAGAPERGVLELRARDRATPRPRARRAAPRARSRSAASGARPSSAS